MLFSERETLKKDIQSWIDDLGAERSSLIPILNNIQRKYRFISAFAMQQVASGLGIHPSEVDSVVSFYHFLHKEPKGQFLIQLCQTISCDMANKSSIAQQLCNDLGIQFGETTPDGKFSLEYSNCIGMCDRGPALLVNDTVHTHVTPSKVHEIINECRSKFGVFATEMAGVEL